VNLSAWHEAFQQHHHWALDLGPVLAVGLSTVRFRSNVYRCEASRLSGWVWPGCRQFQCEGSGCSSAGEKVLRPV
jgi:hypothetical protein